MSDFDLVIETCEQLDRFEVVSNNEWRLVVRRPWPGRPSVIVKLWARPDIKGMLRRLLRISSAYYEWRNLRVLHELGVRAPVPIAMVNMPRNRSGYTEAIVMEDLGPCKEAIKYLKATIASGDEQAVRAFEQQLIDITAAMVRGKVLDWDHGLVNIVATTSGEAVRMDLEQARKVTSLRWSRTLYGQTLGSLLATYSFAVQPDLARVPDFASRLFTAVSATRDTQRLTQTWLNAGLEYQRKHQGITVSVKLPIA
jgi:hypothetical protein